MIYLPDTNAWIGFLNAAGSKVQQRLKTTESSEIRLCSVVKAELYFGAERSSRREENLRLLDELFAGIESVNFDDAAAKKYGKIRSDLAFKGTLIGPNDLMIASIALVNDMVLVTHNTREFSRVATLKIEDWEA
jgi:tRNA(fMet)-specific endonuclease VapC